MEASIIVFILEIIGTIACASLVGSVFCVIGMSYHRSFAMIGGAMITILIRFLAMYYKWNLP